MRHRSIASAEGCSNDRADEARTIADMLYGERCRSGLHWEQKRKTRLRGAGFLTHGLLRTQIVT